MKEKAIPRIVDPFTLRAFFRLFHSKPSKYFSLLFNSNRVKIKKKWNGKEITKKGGNNESSFPVAVV
jgi:hypothetical protein